MEKPFRFPIDVSEDLMHSFTTFLPALLLTLPAGHVGDHRHGYVKNILHQGPDGLDLLRASPSVGALC